MTKLYKTLPAFLLFGIFISLSPYKGIACDRSSFTLVSTSYNAGTGRWSVECTLCIGGGDGSPDGADAATGTRFYITMVWLTGGSAYYHPATTPTSFTGGAGTRYDVWPNCDLADPSMQAIDSLGGAPCGGGTGGHGNLFAGYPDDDNVSWEDYDLTNYFECVSPGSTCGTPHTTCMSIHLEFTSLPDTLRAMGIEGSYPFGGCFPNVDMRFTFPILPVLWAGFDGLPAHGGVDLNWTTVKEKNSSHFLVMRSLNGIDFENIGSLEASGNTDEMKEYKFFDPNPSPGKNYYELRAIDFDGKTGEISEKISVNFLPPSEVTLSSVYPVPSSGRITATIYSPVDEIATAEVLDLQGKSVFKKDLGIQVGNNSPSFDLEGLNKGMYIFKLMSSAGAQETKLIID